MQKGRAKKFVFSNSSDGDSEISAGTPQAQNHEEPEEPAQMTNSIEYAEEKEKPEKLKLHFKMQSYTAQSQQSSQNYPVDDSLEDDNAYELPVDYCEKTSEDEDEEGEQEAVVPRLSLLSQEADEEEVMEFPVSFRPKDEPTSQHATTNESYSEDSWRDKKVQVMKTISQADSLEEAVQKGPQNNNHFLQANSMIEFIEFNGDPSVKERRRHIYSEELKTPQACRRRQNSSSQAESPIGTQQVRSQTPQSTAEPSKEVSKLRLAPRVLIWSVAEAEGMAMAAAFKKMNAVVVQGAKDMDEHNQRANACKPDQIYVGIELTVNAPVENADDIQKQLGQFKHVIQISEPRVVASSSTNLTDQQTGYEQAWLLRKRFPDALCIDINENPREKVHRLCDYLEIDFNSKMVSEFKKPESSGKVSYNDSDLKTFTDSCDPYYKACLTPLNPDPESPSPYTDMVHQYLKQRKLGSQSSSGNPYHDLPKSPNTSDMLYESTPKQDLSKASNSSRHRRYNAVLDAELQRLEGINNEQVKHLQEPETDTVSESEKQLQPFTVSEDFVDPADVYYSETKKGGSGSSKDLAHYTEEKKDESETLRNDEVEIADSFDDEREMMTVEEITHPINQGGFKLSVISEESPSQLASVGNYSIQRRQEMYYSDEQKIMFKSPMLSKPQRSSEGVTHFENQEQDNPFINNQQVFTTFEGTLGGIQDRRKTHGAKIKKDQEPENSEFCSPEIGQELQRSHTITPPLQQSDRHYDSITRPPKQKPTDQLRASTDLPFQDRSLKSRSSQLEMDSQATDLLNSDFNYLKQSHGHENSNPFEQGTTYFGESPGSKLKKLQMESTYEIRLKQALTENAQLKQLLLKYEENNSKLQIEVDQLREKPIMRDQCIQVSCSLVDTSVQTFGPRKKDFYDRVPPKVDTNLPNRHLSDSTKVRKLSFQRSNSPTFKSKSVNKMSSRTVEKKEHPTPKSAAKSSTTAKVQDFNIAMHVDLIDKKLTPLQDDSETSPMTPNGMRNSAKELRRRRENFSNVEDSDVIARLQRLELASTLQNRHQRNGSQELRNEEEWCKQIRSSLRQSRQKLEQNKQQNLDLVKDKNLLQEEIELRDDKIGNFKLLLTSEKSENKNLKVIIDELKNKNFAQEIELGELNRQKLNSQRISDFINTTIKNEDAQMQTDDLPWQEWVAEHQQMWAADIEALMQTEQHPGGQTNDNRQFDSGVEQGSCSTGDQYRIQELLKRANDYDQLHTKLEKEIKDFKKVIKQSSAEQQILVNQRQSFETLPTPLGCKSCGVPQPPKIQGHPHCSQHCCCQTIQAPPSDHNLTQQTMVSPRAAHSTIEQNQGETGFATSQTQIYLLTHQNEQLIAKNKKLNRKLERANSRKTQSDQHGLTLQNKLHSLNEKYRDTKNKFEMRIHERNMKIDDLKSQIAHTFLQLHTTQAVRPGYATHQPVDLSQTVTSALLHPAPLETGSSPLRQNTDQIVSLISGLVEKKFQEKQPQLNQIIEQQRREAEENFNMRNMLSNQHSSSQSVIYPQHPSSTQSNVDLKRMNQHSFEAAKKAENQNSLYTQLQNFGANQNLSHQVATTPSMNLQDEQSKFIHQDLIHIPSRPKKMSKKKSKKQEPVVESSFENLDQDVTQIPELIGLGTLQLTTETFEFPSNSKGQKQSEATREFATVHPHIIEPSSSHLLSSPDQINLEVRSTSHMTTPQQQYTSSSDIQPLYKQLPMKGPEHDYDVSTDGQQYIMSTNIRDMLLKQDEFKDYVVTNDEDKEVIEKKMLDNLRRKYNIN